LWQISRITPAASADALNHKRRAFRAVIVWGSQMKSGGMLDVVSSYSRCRHDAVNIDRIVRVAVDDQLCRRRRASKRGGATMSRMRAVRMSCRNAGLQKL
jgi:hypothetical protein